MNKLLTIAILFAYTGIFAQRTTLPNTATQSPSNKNLNNLNGQVIQDRLVVNDSAWFNGVQNVFPNGNVGIGTTTPEAKLHVSSNDTPSVAIAHFENNLGTAIITVHSHADSSAIYYMQTGAYSAGIGLVGITEKLVITNGLGSVAIEIDTTGITNVLQNLSISNGTASQGKLYFVEDQDNGTNTITLQSPASLAADYTLTFPADDGSNLQVLQTNGNGTLSWVAQTTTSPWQEYDSNTISWFPTDGQLEFAMTSTSLTMIDNNTGAAIIWGMNDFTFNKTILPADSGVQNLGSGSHYYSDAFVNNINIYGIVDQNSTVNTTASDTATINAISGRFRKDATGAAFTLTNSYISTASIILLTPANAAIDATATTWTVAAASGSATITFNAAPTANFDMNFLVIN